MLTSLKAALFDAIAEADPTALFPDSLGVSFTAADLVLKTEGTAHLNEQFAFDSSCGNMRMHRQALVQPTDPL